MRAQSSKEVTIQIGSLSFNTAKFQQNQDQKQPEPSYQQNSGASGIPQTYYFEMPADPSNQHQSNYVSTTKYNIFTFLPIALLRQFKRYANIYFLISALMQCIPLISPLLPFSAIAPLLFVIGLSMAREGYEDVKRYRNDMKSNSSKCIRLDDNGNQIAIQWKDVRTSDLLKIKEDDELPADLIPVVSSSPNGLIYLETASLDGEKNLKPKNSVKQTQLVYNEDPNKFIGLERGKVRCIEPNPNLYQFQGRMNLMKINHEIELTHKNLLPRGSILKNTQYILALVVYTGHNTKIMMNSTSATTNISGIERKLNLLILGILVFQCCCCALSSILSYVQCMNNLSFINFLGQNYSCSTKAGIAFGSYFILYNTFIPISLIVSLEFVKLFQGYFMETDPEMYSYEYKKSMKASTVSINEELGQIEYIMSDKTGTLTCNKMVFKQLMIGSLHFGDKTVRMNKNNSVMSRFSSVQALINEQRRTKMFQPLEKQGEEEDADDFDYDYLKTKMLKTPVTKNPETMQEILADERQVIEELMNIISTCHQCLREPKTHRYQGPSPDEVTLVEFARRAGYEFKSTQNKIITVDKFGRQDTFELLQVFEFDSDRKRMSVVVLHNGVLKLYVKGADATILPRLSKTNQPFLSFINNSATDMSKKGLRSLYYAMKILPMEMKNRVPLTSDIESELTLLGLTGIQDKLQDFVPETISALRTGGIKIVLLTGDKLETAENISRSCGLINESVQIKTGSFDQMRQVYNKIRKDRTLSVIADGSQIDFEENKLLLTNIILHAESTVLCRVTPGQKADVVKMIKDTGKRTLAIGDGANDCNMIMTANVGVGLYGKQGTRAAEVANYSIGEFCLLWKLLLYHGRLNYIRVSQMILYFFYKNMVFTMPQFVFSFFCMGSGQSVYLSWSITFYNMAFTLLPVLITAVFETDVYIEAGKNKLIEVSQKSRDDEEHQKLYQYYPKLYYIGRCNTIFTIKNFVAWFFLGALQGTLCLLINIFTLTNKIETNGLESHPMSFYFLEISLCTCIVIVVNVKLAVNVQRWNVLLIIGFALTFIGYFLYIFLADIVDFSKTKGYHTQLLSTANFYLTQTLSILGMLSMDMFLFSMSYSSNTLQNYIKQRATSGKTFDVGEVENYERSIKSSDEPKTIEQIQKQYYKKKNLKSKSVDGSTKQPELTKGLLETENSIC